MDTIAKSWWLRALSDSRSYVSVYPILIHQFPSTTHGTIMQWPHSQLSHGGQTWDYLTHWLPRRPNTLNRPVMGLLLIIYITLCLFSPSDLTFSLRKRTGWSRFWCWNHENTNADASTRTKPSYIAYVSVRSTIALRPNDPGLTVALDILLKATQ